LQERLGLVARQLARQIRLIAAADPQKRGKIPNIDLAIFRRIFPVFVVMHDEMASILTDRFVEQEFRKESSIDPLLPSDTLRIMRPTVISVHDLEVLVHHTSHTALTTVL